MGEGEEGEGVGVIPTRKQCQLYVPRPHGVDFHTEVRKSLRGFEAYCPPLPLCLDFKVFTRYIYTSLHDPYFPYVYTQDDDCVVNPDLILYAYEPGVVTCNMPLHRRAEYADGVALVGWGAIFDRNLTSVFNLYLRHFPIDDLFLTECDRVFTGLNRVKMIDVPFVNLENAEGADRLHKRSDHWEKLREIRERIGFVKKKEGMA